MTSLWLRMAVRPAYEGRVVALVDGNVGGRVDVGDVWRDWKGVQSEDSLRIRVTCKSVGLLLNVLCFHRL